MNNNTKELLKLIKENPDLPVIPMVDSECVADDYSAYWLGSWGRAEVTEYYMGQERVHLKGDDEEDVLADMEGCKYYCTKDGRDITDLSDEEWSELYASIPWIKAIVVYITA